MAQDTVAEPPPANDYATLAAFYDRICGDRGEEIRFYSGFVRPELDCIDFGCGSGVITRALRNVQVAGFETAPRCGRMVGVDSSIDMLKRATAAAPGVEWVQADMRTFDGRGAFDLAICCFNSLQHMLTLDDLRAALTSMRAAVKVGGEVVFDIFQPHVEFQPAAPRRWVKMELPADEAHGPLTLVETIQFDRDTRVLRIEWELVGGEAGDSLHLGSFGMRHHERDEILAAIEACGFSVQALFGDYDRAAFAESSPKQIYWLKARA